MSSLYSASGCETKRMNSLRSKRTNTLFQNTKRRELKIDLLRILSGVQTRQNTHAMLEYGQYKRWTADCGLRTADCGLRTADCGLRTADCGLRTADCGLRTADCGLRTADCGLRTTDYSSVVEPLSHATKA